VARPDPVLTPRPPAGDRAIVLRYFSNFFRFATASLPHLFRNPYRPVFHGADPPSPARDPPPAAGRSKWVRRPLSPILPGNPYAAWRLCHGGGCSRHSTWQSVSPSEFSRSLLLPGPRGARAKRWVRRGVEGMGSGSA